VENNEGNEDIDNEEMKLWRRQCQHRAKEYENNESNETEEW